MFVDSSSTDEEEDSEGFTLRVTDSNLKMNRVVSQFTMNRVLNVCLSY